MPVRDDVCRLCGASEGVIRFERVGDYITGDEFQIRQCVQCGLEATWPRPSSLARFYPVAYRRFGGATVRILRLLYRINVHGWLRRLPRTGRALELGCGAGWMLAALRDRGWRVFGSERAVDGARVGAAANQIPVFVGEPDALSSAPGFDLIILFHVLEHLATPLETLRQSAGILSADGTIVVAVPNRASWQARVFGPSWFHFDVPRHQHHFSPKTLAAALESVGLRVTHTRFVSFEHDPYGWVQSALNAMGFRQNLLTRMIMGMDTPGAGLTTVVPMVVLAGLLAVPALVIALGSWACGSGALVQMWAVPVRLTDDSACATMPTQ